MTTANTHLCVDAAFSLISVHFPHFFNLREHEGPSQQGSAAPYLQGGLRQPLLRRLKLLLHAGIVLCMSECLDFFLFFNQRCIK